MRKSICLILTVIMVLSAFGTACASEPETGGSIASGFLDVPADLWYADAVRFVRDAGLMVGTSDTSFSPDSAFTRAQLAVVLYRIAGEPAVSGSDSFTDTDPGTWYSDAILWAEQKGVVRGIGNSLYGTNMPVTQEQMAVMLWRMEGQPAAAEASDSSSYAAVAAGWIRSTGIAPESEYYSFAPRSNASRAQIASILNGYITYRETLEDRDILLTVEGKRIDVEWADNSSVEALKELLKQGGITLDMSDYAGFEKGAPLPESLPQNNRNINADAGDIILYQGSQFVIYYDTNSWSLTPLGKIKGMSKSEIQTLLGPENVAAELSLAVVSSGPVRD